MIKVEKKNIRLEFIEDVLGSYPADPALLTKFVANKAPSDWLAEEEIEVAKNNGEDYEKNVTVFPQDEKGLFFYNYHIKGFLKEAGNVLKDNLKVKNLRAKIDRYVFVQPRRLYLTRPDGEIIREEDDVLERPLRGQTMKGERITLVASERVKAPVQLEFTIELLENKEVTWELIQGILEYGKYKGLGQWRNGGFGRFTWEFK